MSRQGYRYVEWEYSERGVSEEAVEERDQIDDGSQRRKKSGLIELL